MDDWEIERMTHKRFKPMRELFFEPEPAISVEQSVNNPWARQEPPASLRGIPAVTTNAVAPLGEDRPNYNTEFRRGYDSAPKASTSAQPRNSSNTPGPVSRYSPNASMPYPGAESPGQRAATYLPNMPGIQFNAAPSVAGMPNDLGNIPMSMQHEMQSLFDEARPLLSRSGIVDRLRGRQLMRARARLSEDAIGRTMARTQGYNAQTGMIGAQTNAFRASNEVPLARLQAATSQYGSDTQRYGIDTTAGIASMRDVTDRRGQDTAAEASRYATNMGLLPRMGDVYQGEEIGRRLAAGDMEGAAEIARMGRFPPATRARPYTMEPQGQGVFTEGEDGLPRYLPRDEIDVVKKRERDEKARNAR